MAVEVRRTPIAKAQVAGLRGPNLKAFERFVTALAERGCAALDYRVTGEHLDKLETSHATARTATTRNRQNNDHRAGRQPIDVSRPERAALLTRPALMGARMWWARGELNHSTAASYLRRYAKGRLSAVVQIHRWPFEAVLRRVVMPRGITDDLDLTA